MAVRHTHRGEPHKVYSLLEWRALIEIALLPYSIPMLATAPKGDGHPVPLLPGFMAEEGTLFALKVFLRSRGYDVHTWEFGATSASMPGMRRRSSRRSATCTTRPAAR